MASVEGEKPLLESVLDHYDVKQKHGRQRYMTHCPLHQDKTPSLSVNLDKQVWRCHSCGEAGDAWTLIEKMEATDFRGARTFAATLGLATGSDGSEQLTGSRYGGRRSKSPVKRDSRRGGYIPAWKRGSS